MSARVHLHLLICDLLMQEKPLQETGQKAGHRRRGENGGEGEAFRMKVDWRRWRAYSFCIGGGDERNAWVTVSQDLVARRGSTLDESGRRAPASKRSGHAGFLFSLDLEFRIGHSGGTRPCKEHYAPTSPAIQVTTWAPNSVHSVAMPSALSPSLRDSWGSRRLPPIYAPAPRTRLRRKARLRLCPTPRPARPGTPRSAAPRCGAGNGVQRADA